MDIKKCFYNKLPGDKIKINWNKKPIKMDVFLSFLTVKTERSYDHLGCLTGWTLLKNENIKLFIGGGVVGGLEYLDSLRFGVKLSNPYNNYVNPFYLWGVLNSDGRKFFIDYYASEIDGIVNDSSNKISSLQNQLADAEKLHNGLIKEVGLLRQNSSTSLF